MRDDQTISRALEEIAREAVPSESDLWPALSAGLGRGELHLGSRGPGALRILVIAAGVLLAVAGAAYICVHEVLDPGLLGVRKAGLVADLQETAQATLFPTADGAAARSGSSTTSPRVTLEWAYGDESRLAMALTVRALALPSGTALTDVICNPYISDEQRIPIDIYPMETERFADRDGLGIRLIYVGLPHFEGGDVDHLDLHMDLTIGPCSPYWNFDETNLPRPTPFPLLGNYHLDFRVPIYHGVVVNPDQTVVAAGVPVRLEALTLNPSFTVARLCFPSPDEALAAGGWWEAQASIRIGNGETVASTANSPDLSTGTAASCTQVGFPVPYNGTSAPIVITIDRLVANGIPFDLSDPALQAVVREKLAAQRIEVEFVTEGSQLWRIVKKPAGMSDAEVDGMVFEAMTEVREGAWVFVVNVAP